MEKENTRIMESPHVIPARSHSCRRWTSADQTQLDTVQRCLREGEITEELYGYHPTVAYHMSRERTEISALEHKRDLYRGK